MPEIVRDNVHRIVITGPESSGKSTLVSALEMHYNGLKVPEYARTYLQHRGTQYGLEDLEEILIGQLSLEDMMAETADRFLFCDTGPLVLKVWAEFKFGQCPASIETAFRERDYSLYLLCKPDLPWVPDPLRENPNDREKLFEMYLHNLAQYGKNFQVISGREAADRLQQTKEAIEAIPFGEDRSF